MSPYAHTYTETPKDDHVSQKIHKTRTRTECTLVNEELQMLGINLLSALTGFFFFI